MLYILDFSAGYNAAIHTARRSEGFFQSNSIRLLDHSPCQSDLNPIKNSLGWMARDVYKNRAHFETVGILSAKLCSPHGETNFLHSEFLESSTRLV